MEATTLPVHPVRRAAEQLGSFDALAEAVGVTKGAVWQWTLQGRPVPIGRCLAIERVTIGKVRRWHLRPHDWHRIWPELVGQPGAPEVLVAHVA